MKKTKERRNALLIFRQYKASDNPDQKRNDAKSKHRREVRTALLFLAPSLLGVSIFIFFPFLDALRRSFFGAMNGKFVGFRNYLAVFENQAFQLAAGNTLRFIGVCIPVLLLFSLLLGLLINVYKDRSGLFKTSFLIPMAVPVASIALLWKALFNENGIMNAFLIRLGYDGIRWMNSDWAFVVLVFSYLWKNVGYDMVLWLAGLSNIAPDLYEAAQVDGASAVQRFFHITLPNLLSTLFTITVISLLNSFKVFREAYLIGGSYPHDSIYMLQHLFNNWFVSLDIDKLCAAATVLALTVFLLITILQKIWASETEYE